VTGCSRLVDKCNLFWVQIRHLEETVEAYIDEAEAHNLLNPSDQSSSKCGEEEEEEEEDIVLPPPPTAPAGVAGGECNGGDDRVGSRIDGEDKEEGGGASGAMYRSLRDEDIKAIQAQLREQLSVKEEGQDKPISGGEYDIEEEVSSPRPLNTPRVLLSTRPRTPRDDLLFSPRLDGSGGIRYGAGEWGARESFQNTPAK
jgi:hypothetical protein